ncbi:hypothetical protein [Novosphingobium sp.]|uniref:hypothetical protein n=1 Tax=Novosphingobium sp. TaxID=1874826 RepID=UPI0028A9347E|nr:hypothetical protein [Novosphingobium sp.]
MSTTTSDIAAGMKEAGWLPIADAPKDQRIRVAHLLDPSSQKVETIFPVYGEWDGDSWACNAGFVCVDRMLRFDPTHYLPSAPSQIEEG